ncbi:MAG TPA: DUF523 and DUF1722 domain-containing protein [Syntrophales bacterium]|nr:DUF523 and DUF1722 domain-containing protein [Syntrophales bacterium]
MEKIRIGISSCLLGNEVRWDGGHALDRFMARTIGGFVDYLPVCPEVECGFGTPRDTFRLVGDPRRPRLEITRTGADHTARMETWARRRVEELGREKLCGFIFKSSSPSCGMECVKVYGARGVPRKAGEGIFARIFMERFPLTPVEEEGRLYDPALRENFIERIFACKRYSDIREGAGKARRLVDFHAEHRLQLMAHSPKRLKEMDGLVARAKQIPARELVGRYEKFLMEAMALKPTAARHENVLTHIMGCFKRDLGGGEKRELLDVIRAYRKGLIPLVVPVTLLAHYARTYGPPCLKEQTYLNPHPVELRLRYHL